VNDKKIFELESKLQISEGENGKLKTELEGANSAKKMFSDELEKAKKSAPVVAATTDDDGSKISDVDLSFEQGVPQLKEKLARLERENEVLKQVSER